MANFILSAFADEASPSLDGQIEALLANRISLVELRGVDKKGILDLTVGEAQEAQAKLAANGIGVSAIGSPIGKIPVTQDFAPHFEKFRHAVELARIFGTDRIRMFSFYIPKGEDPEAYFGEVVERIGRLVEYAEENGVHCCHENEKGIYGDTLDRPCAACSIPRTTSSAAMCRKRTLRRFVGASTICTSRTRSRRPGPSSPPERAAVPCRTFSGNLPRPERRTS